jgi:copper(I)-binding protein
MPARLLLVFAIALWSAAAGADVTVTDVWIRGTVAGQHATGAFMQLRSAGDASLVAVATPAAKSAELHTMSHDNGIMKMRAVSAIALPAGKTVELGPGGYHVMLLDIARPMKEGESVALTLTFADKDGRKTTQDVTATVRALNAPAMKH